MLDLQRLTYTFEEITDPARENRAENGEKHGILGSSFEKRNGRPRRWPSRRIALTRRRAWRPRGWLLPACTKCAAPGRSACWRQQTRLRQVRRAGRAGRALLRRMWRSTGGCYLPGLRHRAGSRRALLQPVRQTRAVTTMRRRVAIAGVLTIGGLQLSGCAERPLRPPDDRYCFHAMKRSGSKPTCTPGPVPDLAVDAKAKLFEPVPGSLVVYVVRRRWGDTAYAVNVAVDGGALVATTPASLVRLVVAPGIHRLSFEWKKGKGELDLRGDAGQVLFVELIGSLWFWNEWYRLEMGDSSVRDRALKSRLVADVKVGKRE